MIKNTKYLFFIRADAPFCDYGIAYEEKSKVTTVTSWNMTEVMSVLENRYEFCPVVDIKLVVY